MHTQASSQILRYSGNLQNRPNLLDESLAFFTRQVALAEVSHRVIMPSCEVDARIRRTDSFSLVYGSGSGGVSARIMRRASQIGRDGKDRVHLVMNCRSSTYDVSHCGRRQRLTPGSFTFLSEADPCISDMSNNGNPSAALILVIPRERIDQPLIQGERFCARSVGGSDSYRSLLAGTIRSLAETAWDMTTEEFLSAA